jgi:hypothetical protein
MRLRDSQIRNDFRRGFIARPHAVRNADAAVRVSRKREAWRARRKLPNAFYPGLVAERVLGHCFRPSVNFGEQRFGGEVENSFELAPDENFHFSVRQLKYSLIPAAAEKTTQQRPIRWNTPGELVVHEGAGEYAFAFASRNEKSKTRG